MWRTCLMYVNAKMWIGHFDLWPEDGTIVFRHAMIFPEAQASAAQCEALLNLAVEACEYYYPAFQFVLWGGKIRRGSRRRRRARMRRAGVGGADPPCRRGPHGFGAAEGLDRARASGRSKSSS